MNTNLHLVFNGQCDEAFSFYEGVFKTKRVFTMKFGETPEGMPIADQDKNLIMHTAMPLGKMTLMGCDSPSNQPPAAIGGFQISVDTEDEAEVKRIFAEISDGGSVIMPLTPTFWSPLFGMCTDKFGVGWMVSIPGPQV